MEDERFEATLKSDSQDITGKGSQSTGDQAEDGDQSENHPQIRSIIWTRAE